MEKSDYYWSNSFEFDVIGHRSSNTDDNSWRTGLTAESELFRMHYLISTQGFGLFTDVMNDMLLL